MAMTVRPTYAANEERSGESDDDPDRMDDLVDEVMAKLLNGLAVDYDSQEGSRAPGPQAGERLPAAGSGPLAARKRCWDKEDFTAQDVPRCWESRTF